MNRIFFFHHQTATCIENMKLWNTSTYLTKKLAGELSKYGVSLLCKSMQGFEQKLPTIYKKTLKCVGNNSWMSSPGVTFNLTSGKGVNELKNLTNQRLLSFAESHHMQQKNFDVSPYGQ